MATDILIGENGEMIFKDGDFAWGDSLYQERKELLLARTEHYKLVDVKCVGLKDYIQAQNPVMEVERKVKEAYTSDGIRFSRISVSQIPGIIYVEDYGEVSRD